MTVRRAVVIAAVASQMFSQSLCAQTTLDERAAAETRENLAQMPDLADRIRNDTTAERAELYGEILSKPHLFRDLDEQVLDALLVAAADKDAKGRAAAMRLIGQRWIWNEPKEKQNPKAIDLAERLATDSDAATRNWAIYFGLSTIIEPDDKALRAMVDGLVMPNPSDSAGRVDWASERFGKDRLKPFFEPYFAKGADAARSARAVAAYTTIFGQPPTNVAATQPADRDYAGAFKAAYDHLGEVYPAFEMKKIDWKKVGDELLPRAATIKTDREFGLLCLELVARLQDSHAQLLPGTAEVPTIDFPHFDAGFACITDTRDRPVIYYVDPDGPAERAGVRVGMTVVSVNGVPANDAINAWLTAVLRYNGASSDRTARYDAVRYFAQTMKENDAVKLDVETLDGTHKTFDLTATLDSRYVPRLPVPIDGINDSADVSFKRLDRATPGEIGYLHIRRIRDNLPASLDQAIKAFNEPPKIKGLILDVRGNSGGGFDDEAALRNFHENDPLEPGRPRYAGPIAMLIDERCISAGEGWSSWFVANKKARLFGTTTAGASSRKEEYALTNGLYKILVPVKTYMGFLDRPIEVRGLEPDEPVRCRAADLAAGKDTVLEAARTWLTR